MLPLMRECHIAYSDFSNIYNTLFLKVEENMSTLISVVISFSENLLTLKSGL